MDTPDSIIGEMVAMRHEMSKGVEATYRAEIKMAELDLEADKAEALALINAEGTVPDRQATAKLLSADQRLAAEIAKAEYNRARTKMRVLEVSLSSLQSQGKLIEAMYRNAGLGEH